MSRPSAGAAVTPRRHDARIRRALTDYLRASVGPGTVIAGELGILEGRSRVDVACVHDRAWMVTGDPAAKVPGFIPGDEAAVIGFSIGVPNQVNTHLFGAP